MYLDTTFTRLIYGPVKQLLGFLLKLGYRRLSIGEDYLAAVADQSPRLFVHGGQVRWWGVDAVDAALATDSRFEYLETSLDGGDGIHAGARSRLIACRATFNWFGIGLDAGADSLVAASRASHNGFGGIRTGARSRVEDCLVEGNTYGAGILMGEGSSALRCRSRRNDRAGLVGGDGCEVVG